MIAHLLSCFRPAVVGRLLANCWLAIAGCHLLEFSLAGCHLRFSYLRYCLLTSLTSFPSLACFNLTHVSVSLLAICLVVSLFITCLNSSLMLTCLLGFRSSRCPWNLLAFLCFRFASLVYFLAGLLSFVLLACILGFCMPAFLLPWLKANLQLAC